MLYYKSERASARLEKKKKSSFSSGIKKKIKKNCNRSHTRYQYRIYYILKKTPKSFRGKEKTVEIKKKLVAIYREGKAFISTPKNKHYVISCCNFSYNRESKRFFSLLGLKKLK